MNKSIYLDEDTYDKLVLIADEKNRSMVDQIRFWIKMEKSK